MNRFLLFLVLLGMLVLGLLLGHHAAGTQMTVWGYTFDKGLFAVFLTGAVSLTILFLVDLFRDVGYYRRERKLKSKLDAVRTGMRVIQDKDTDEKEDEVQKD